MRFLSYVLVILSLVAVATGAAIADSHAPRSAMGVLADSTLSGYSDRGGIGGPEAIDAELEFNNQKSESFFRIPVRLFQPWYDLKARSNEKYGIRYGLNYTSVFIKSSDGITERSETNAAGGIIDIPVSWLLVGRDSGNTGSLSMKLENRHPYSTVAPMLLGFETGSILLPATKVNEFSFRFTELHWQQILLGGQLHVVTGKVDPTNYYTFHGLIHPFMNYYSYAFSVTPSANWPNQGAGVIVSGLDKSRRFYVMAGLHDAGGDPFESGDWLYFGDNFFDGNFFTAVEVGYTPSFGERYFKKVSATYWHADAYEGSPAGQGVAFASHWFLQERYIPFLLAGFSDGKGANTIAKNTVSAGMGFRFKSHDVLGVGLNWTDPAGGFRDQYTAEVYYRFYLTEHLAITPDFQFIADPALNTSQSTLTYFGIRGRVTL